MRSVIALIACLSVAAPAGLMAQGSAPSGGFINQSFVVTRSVSGTVVAVDVEGQKLTVEDAKQKRFDLALARETRFRADKQTPFQGRKDLTMADLATGQMVKVTYRGSDNVVTEVRWTRPKS